MTFKNLMFSKKSKKEKQVMYERKHQNFITLERSTNFSVKE
jgi:hypothetical protein